MHHGSCKGGCDAVAHAVALDGRITYLAAPAAKEISEMLGDVKEVII